jgi:hypothetical protein
VNIIGISLLFYGRNEEQVNMGWKTTTYIAGILTLVQVLLAVLCETLLIHLIGAFHSFFNEDRARTWIAIFVCLYTLLTSLYNVNSASIIISGSGVISNLLPYYDTLNGILLFTWCILAILYPLLQNIYIGWSFYKLREKKDGSDKKLVTQILILLLLGFAMDMLTVGIFMTLPNTVEKNKDLNLHANALRVILVSIIGNEIIGN